MTSAPAPSISSSAHTARAFSKVPEVTALFWVIKVLTTGAGETSSDFLVTHLDPIIGVAIAFVAFVVALTLQFRADRYRPVLYWFAVVMVSVFGTMVADVIHVVLGVPYLVSAPAFAILLAAVFVVWHRVEGTLSIHSITTRRREVFYWCAILATFALGTATGDLTATTFHLGYLASGLVFTAVIAIPALWFAIGRRHAIVTFWFAYVVTRPLGASYADWMGVDHARGGLAWGTGPVSIVLLVLIAALVAVLARRATAGRHRPITA
ncbi:putative membrane-anchored protein [Frondihabitans australicus]|uniref:Putative membrane-anchored protein n=2 Tax=Frondihabitans australicus TaxID=386892 RepID=A0A495IN28_9MICO|nr:putative membrane-anchored protein [Frondihabitans australicus]